MPKIVMILSSLLSLFFFGRIEAAPYKGASLPKVVILYSFNAATPWQRRFKKGLHGFLDSAWKKVDLYEESIDAGRFNEPSHRRLFADYLRKKYRGMSMVLAVTESGPASEFLQKHPDLWPGAPRLYVNPSPEVGKAIGLQDRKSVLAVKGNVPEALRRLNRVFRPKRIVVVGETKTPVTGKFIMELKRRQKELIGTLPVEYLLDLPMRDLQNRLSRLPKGSVVFYTLIFQDGAGRHYVPFEAARLLVESSPVPVFSHWDSLLGSGIAGGYMLSGEEVGKIAARDILDLAYGKRRSEKRIPEEGFREIYDWRVLERYGMPTDRIPEDALWLGRHESFWEKYRAVAIVAVSLFVILLLLLALWNLSLRRQVAKRKK